MLIQKNLISLVKKKVQNAKADLKVRASIGTTLCMGCKTAYGNLLSLQTICLGVPQPFMQHKTQANLEVSTSLKREAVLAQGMAASLWVLSSMLSHEAYATSTKPTASCWGQGNALA